MFHERSRALWGKDSLTFSSKILKGKKFNVGEKNHQQISTFKSISKSVKRIMSSFSHSFHFQACSCRALTPGTFHPVYLYHILLTIHLAPWSAFWTLSKKKSFSTPSHSACWFWARHWRHWRVVKLVSNMEKWQRVEAIKEFRVFTANSMFLPGRLSESRLAGADLKYKNTSWIQKTNHWQSKVMHLNMPNIIKLTAAPDKNFFL